MAYPTAIEAYELPRIVRLRDNLYGACFPLMKQLPARFILDRARADGRLRPTTTVIETTSGTFGLALAMVCSLRGYRLVLVSDPVIDDVLRRRLEDLGARVDIVTGEAKVGGVQQARLDRVNQLRAQYPDHFWPAQYDNPHNVGAYAPFAELLTESVGRVDCVVGTVGSGGSMCGTSRYLRTVFPSLRGIGIDTHGSVLFGLPDRKRVLRGLGNSLMPRNLDHRCFDEVHWVSAAEAFRATRALHRRHALYMGATSGAAFLIADWYAAQHPDRVVVALFPDEGHRYQATIYNDAWLRGEGLALPALPTGPATVARVGDVGAGWTRFCWNRRGCDEVLAAERKAPPAASPACGA